jgi:hypothetical protein
MGTIALGGSITVHAGCSVPHMEAEVGVPTCIGGHIFRLGSVRYP